MGQSEGLAVLELAMIFPKLLAGDPAESFRHIFNVRATSTPVRTVRRTARSAPCLSIRRQLVSASDLACATRSQPLDYGIRPLPARFYDLHTHG